MRTAYFDNSVLDAVALQRKGERLKTELRIHAIVGHGSAQNLIEAFGISDRTTRMDLVRTILQVARQRELHPLLYTEVRTVVNQLRLHHPDWVISTPEMKLINQDLGAYRRLWLHVAADHGYLPRGFVMNRAFQYAVIGESKRRAREARDDRLRRRPKRSPIVDPVVQAGLQPLIDSVGSDAEWRLEAAGIWWNALQRRDQQMVSLSDFLVPFVRVPVERFEDWVRFWLVEVDGSAVNVTRAQVLAALFQADTRVNAGSSGDVLHTAQATQCDVILTADQDFHGILQRVAAIPGVAIGRPVFVDRGRPDILVEIAAALGW